MVRNGDYNLAIAPSEYPGRRYHHDYCLEHHLVWWDNTGEVVTEDEVIHHKNGDKTDNRFENLKKMSRAEHASHHASTGRTIAILKCPECGSIFERERRSTHLSNPSRKATFCTKSCAGKFAHKDEEVAENVLGTYVD